MAQLLNPRHELFCQNYVRSENSGNYTGSYEAAGYSPHAGNASRLAAQSHIKRRIAELIAEGTNADQEATRLATEALAISREKLLAEYARIGFANIADYLYADDNDDMQFDLARIDHAQAAAIGGLRFHYAKSINGDPPRIAGVQVKMLDKRFALTALGRHLGMFTARPPKEAPAPKTAPALDPSTQLTAAEMEGHFVQIFARLAAQKVDLFDLLNRAIEAGTVKIEPDAYPLREHIAIEGKWEKPWPKDGV